MEAKELILGEDEVLDDCEDTGANEVPDEEDHEFRERMWKQ